MLPYNTLRCHPNMSHFEQLPQHQSRGCVYYFCSISTEQNIKEKAPPK